MQVSLKKKKNTLGNRVHFYRGGCDCRQTYISCFYPGTGLKLMFQSKTKKKTELPADIQEEIIPSRPASVKETNDLIREKTPKNLIGFKHIRMEHNAALLTLRCFRTAPVFAKQSPHRQSLNQPQTPLLPPQMH